MGLHNTKVYTYNIFWKYLRHKRKWLPRNLSQGQYASVVMVNWFANLAYMVQIVGITIALDTGNPFFNGWWRHHIVPWVICQVDIQTSELHSGCTSLGRLEWNQMLIQLFIPKQMANIAYAWNFKRIFDKFGECGPIKLGGSSGI
jgi:hypothetical protein